MIGTRGRRVKTALSSPTQRDAVGCRSEWPRRSRYAWEFSSWNLLAYAVVVASASFFIVPLAFTRYSARFFEQTRTEAEALLEEDRRRLEAEQRQAQERQAAQASD